MPMTPTLETWANSLDAATAELVTKLIEEAVAVEREACAQKAREFASHYDDGSDGRNTFVILAEWIENRT